MEQLDTYNAIHAFFMENVYMDEAPNRASRLSNKMAVKYTWEIFNIINGPYAINYGDISNLLDIRSPMCILPPHKEKCEFVRMFER